MDVTKITKDDIAKMSEDELRTYVRSILSADSDDDTLIRAAIVGPNGEHVTLKHLVKDIGEDAVVELIVKAFMAKGVQCHTMTKEEYEALAEKAANGEDLTEEEERLLRAITGELHNDMLSYQHSTLGMILEVLDYSQNEVGYEASVTDIGIVFHMLAMETLRNFPDSRLSMYGNDGNGLSVLMQASREMSDDIMNTWTASLTEEPDDGMVIMALATALLDKMASYENKLKKRLALPPVDYLRKALGFAEVEDDSEHECDCGGNCGSEECQCHNETEDGSNKHKTLNFDEMMRNMLKS